MLGYHFSDSDCERFFATDQCWDRATLKEIREKYNIFFRPDSATPLMVIPRPGINLLIVIGWEDDGTIGFNKRNGGWENCFDSYWLDGFLADLQATAAAIEADTINKNVDLSIEYYAD